MVEYVPNSIPNRTQLGVFEPVRTQNVWSWGPPLPELGTDHRRGENRQSMVDKKA